MYGSDNTLNKLGFLECGLATNQWAIGTTWDTGMSDLGVKMGHNKGLLDADDR